MKKDEGKFQAAPPQGECNDSACKRCGGLLQLSALLPKRLDSPAYEIFRCVACGFVDWVAQDAS